MHKNHKCSNLFNISLLGKDGCGKSRIADAFLKLENPKETKKLVVESPEETARNYNVYNHFYHLDRGDHSVNFIDTPGNTDFLPKVKTALFATNASVFVVSGEGFDDTLFRIWEAIQDYKKPCIIYINKMDVGESDFEKTLGLIENNLGVSPTVLLAPWLDNGNLVGVIDVLRRKMIRGNSGQFEEGDLIEEFKEQIESYRETAIERLAEVDDELMELYLEGEEISEKQLFQGLKNAFSQGLIYPIMAGSGTAQIGITYLDEFIKNNSPNHESSSSWIGKSDLDSDDIVEREPNHDAAAAAFVIKTVHDKFAGKLSYLLVVSGNIKKSTVLYNPHTKNKLTLGKISIINSLKTEEIETAGPGDIVVLEKVDGLETNYTLHDPNHPIIFDPIAFKSPHCTYRIDLEKVKNEEKLIASLHKILSEDPSLKLEKNEETNEFLLSGMGMTHLNVAKDHLKNMYNLEMELGTPHIGYRETITKKIVTEGKHKKQSGGHGQFGIVTIEVEPLPRGSGFEFINKIVGGIIPKQYIPAVEIGCKKAMAEGPLGKFPTVDVRVTLFDGKYHTVDSSDFSFQCAGIIAMRDALSKANPLLLEPIMHVQIDIPEGEMGKVSKDLSSRRGRILGYETKGKVSLITADVPLSELLDYASTLRGMTQGLGLFTMQQKGYEVVLPQFQDGVVKQRQEELAKN